MSPRAHPLVSRFAEARLPLELASAPIITRGAVGAESIVQLDITRRSRGRARLELFRLWTGHPDNRVEVQSIDRKLEQLVLMIHEPRRRFEVQVPRFASVPRSSIVRETGIQRWMEQWTSDTKRHFLCGMDEQHLFIAQLPVSASTVRAAHEALKDPRVTAAERSAPSRTIRQGEWFFVALSSSEARDLDAQIGRGLLIRKHAGIAEAAGIRRIGRPHVADEVFVVPGQRDERGTPLPVAYVRGAVRHPDHRTVVFPSWRRVIPNRESLAQPVQGIAWVD